MTFTRRHGSWVIVLTFIIALTLTALPLPEWAELWRPAWAAMQRSTTSGGCDFVRASWRVGFARLPGV